MKSMRSLGMAAALAAASGDFLGDITRGRTPASDIRCKEKKVAKRRALNKMKKKSR